MDESLPPTPQGKTCHTNERQRGVGNFRHGADDDIVTAVLVSPVTNQAGGTGVGKHDPHPAIVWPGACVGGEFETQVAVKITDSPALIVVPAGNAAPGVRALSFHEQPVKSTELVPKFVSSQ